MLTAGEVRTFTKRVDTEVPALQRYILGFTGERRMVAVHAYVKKVRHRPHGNSRGGLASGSEKWKS